MPTPDENLFIAVRHGDLTAARAALAAGADPNAAGPSGGESPLMQIRLGRDRERMLRLLLDHGGDPRRSDLAGRTALHHLAMTGEPPLVDLLLAHGADAEARDADGLRPFDVALSHGREVGVLRLLLAAMPAADRNDRTRLFHWYLQRGKSAEALDLIAAGINLDRLTEHAMPSLYMACAAGEIAIVDALLDAGAEVDALFGAGETALFAATRHGHAVVVDCLLAAGAAAAHRDKQGGSALHAAARSNAAGQDALIDVSKRLLAAGADPLLCDDHGYWPRAAARAHGHGRLAAELPAAPGEPSISADLASIAVVDLGRLGDARVRWRPNDLLRPFSIEEHLGRDEWGGRDFSAREFSTAASGLLRQPELAWIAPLLQSGSPLTLAAIRAAHPGSPTVHRFNRR